MVPYYGKSVTNNSHIKSFWSTHAVYVYFNMHYLFLLFLKVLLQLVSSQLRIFFPISGESKLSAD